MSDGRTTANERLARIDAAIAVLDDTYKHLTRLRAEWLAANPRDPILDAYEHGINVPAGRTRWDDQIAAIDAARLVLIGHMHEVRQRTFPPQPTPLRPTKPVVVIGVATDADGNALMEWRDDFIPGGGWAFPGGKVDHDEHPSNALAREWMEETGVLLIWAMPLDPVDAGSYLNLPYLITSWHGEFPKKTLDAGHRLEWRDLREQVNDPRWPASQQIARQAMARLNPDAS